MKMEKATEAILTFLLHRNYIGAKHFPERQLIISRTKWLNRDEKKRFEEEYRDIVSAGLIMKMKKRTGKGSEWHISLNPERLRDVYGMIDDD